MRLHHSVGEITRWGNRNERVTNRTHHTVCYEYTLKHWLILSRKRLTIKIAEDVARQYLHVISVLSDLLNLLPVENISCSKYPREPCHLKCGVNFNVPVRSKYIRAKGCNKVSIGTSSPGWDLWFTQVKTGPKIITMHLLQGRHQYAHHFPLWAERASLMVWCW